MFGKFEPCTFDKWARFDSWPIRQVAFILMGYEPPPIKELFPTNNHWAAFVESSPGPITWGHVLDGSRDDYIQRICTSYQPWERVLALRDMARGLDIAVNNGFLPWKRVVEHEHSVIYVNPAEVVKWARGKNFHIPPELEALFPETTPTEPALADSSQFKETDLLVTISRLLLLVKDLDKEIAHNAEYTRKKFVRGSGVSIKAVSEGMEAILNRLDIPTDGLGDTKTRDILTAALRLGAAVPKEES
ncbi:MAG: hypothetical protein RKR03_08810 [Candidatus Competibacter sp.]|nr:hypothetical protein [Candidatus Competibacter sp.]